MAVALLALFVALGGTGYAASKVNGRTIVNGSITGKKLKRNTLGGREIRESRLGKVPSASDADQLDGRPASAYLLVGNTAANASHLNGFDASAFLPANGTAANASAPGGLPPSAYLGAGATAADADKLGGKAASAYLGAADTAANADKLDGLDSAAFAPAGKVQGSGPVTLAMPATDGDTSEVTLFSNGPLTVVGQCRNSGGTAVATVGLRHTVEVFSPTQSSGKALTISVSSSVVPLASVTSTGGLPAWDLDRETFTVFSNPSSGSAAIQGSATAITQNNPRECFLGAWGVTS
jgi:hypothetical protein